MPISLGLVVDDDPHVRHLFTRALIRAGIRTVEARSGLEAIELAQHSAFDFVVTDIELPQMDGVELCRRLRQLTATTIVPIVVVSGTPMQAHEATAAGCDVVLLKPCAPKLLLETIQRLLAQRTEPASKQ